jgi:hypothetical protein
VRPPLIMTSGLLLVRATKRSDIDTSLRNKLVENHDMRLRLDLLGIVIYALLGCTHGPRVAVLKLSDELLAARAAFPGTALLKSMPDDRPRGPLSMPQDVEVGLVTSTVTDSLFFCVGSPSDWTHRVTDSVSRSGASEGATILMYRACDPPLGRVTCAPGTV